MAPDDAENTKKQARDILRAIGRARADLSGTGPAGKRAGRATGHFSAFIHDGLFAPHVRDVYDATGVRAVTLALDTLESLVKGAIEPDDTGKLREDANETAFRTLQEALGERPKTKPPSERSEEEKNPEAQQRGSKGGKKGGPARAEKLSREERSESARKAATERWTRE